MNKVQRFPRLAGLGELLWDVLPESETLGGAPANFACHVQALGAHASLVSTVGSDGRENKARDILAHSGVDTACISTIDQAPTGYVQAELDEKGVATYRFPGALFNPNRNEWPAVAVAVPADRRNLTAERRPPSISSRGQRGTPCCY